MDPTQAQYLDLPFQFSSIFCLFYCAGRQLLAITKSGLLPSFLEKTIPGADTPYYCYTFAAIVGVGLNLFVLYYPEHLAEVKAVSSTSSCIDFHFLFDCFYDISSQVFFYGSQFCESIRGLFSNLWDT